MQKARTEKTELALKALLVAAITGLVIVLLLIFSPHKQDVLTVDNQRITLDVAATIAQQEKGLGDRAFLPKDKGMLFVFSNPSIQCFWMKDTNFPLDIIWINAAKKVLYVQPNISPKTYPKTFCPSVLASYVIEINSGLARQLGVAPGITLQF